MSLDIYLNDKIKGNYTVCPNCGHKHEPTDTEQVFSYNITHNLGEMASKANLYEPLWCPEELGIKKASELTSLLEKGLATLKEAPNYYKKFNPGNGWGKYENLVEFVENYLQATKDYPDAIIEASR